MVALVERAGTQAAAVELALQQVARPLTVKGEHDAPRGMRASSPDPLAGGRALARIAVIDWAITSLRRTIHATPTARSNAAFPTAPA